MAGKAVGLFSFLFGPSPKASRFEAAKPAGMLVIAGEGDFDFDIVGESHYQDILSQACGGKCEDGHGVKIAVELEPEPDNPHDANAVRVVMAGHTIGHLSRADAAEYRQALAEAGYAGWTAHCFGLIVGGWIDDVSEGAFGVKLDIDFPPDFRFAPE